jgi:hypothetical protein
MHVVAKGVSAKADNGGVVVVVVVTVDSVAPSQRSSGLAWRDASCVSSY